MSFAKLDFGESLDLMFMGCFQRNLIFIIIFLSFIFDFCVQKDVLNKAFETFICRSAKHNT
jgi:hypothetical protein